MMSSTEIDRILEMAASYRAPDPERLAKFLVSVGEEILELGQRLISVCNEETALPEERLLGERTRTINQLRLFADLVKEGSWVDARIDIAQPARPPVPKPDLRRMLIPLGPVAVFAASNFPLAFSVAGGDTASAIAAGCAVIVKPHPGHLRTSELVASAIRRAASHCAVPPGAFGLVEGSSIEAGLELIRHPLLKAVGFTGSLQAGRALFDAAGSRPDPIPVFAEMGSQNPLFVLPDALATRTEVIAQGLADSVALGVGQFCTKPGLLFVTSGERARDFSSRLAAALSKKPQAKMLNGRIEKRFKESLEALHPFVCTESPMSLLEADAVTYRGEPKLHQEIFGPATLLVTCQDIDEMAGLAAELEGQLTATLHATSKDLEYGGRLIKILQEKAGRLVWNGYPTGVEVCPSMHHGGPYPATTDARFTSVGTAAIQRFARPVCYQNVPEELLPVELRNKNLRKIWRTINGALSKEDAQS